MIPVTLLHHSFVFVFLVFKFLIETAFVLFFYQLILDLQQIHYNIKWVYSALTVKIWEDLSAVTGSCWSLNFRAAPVITNRRIINHMWSLFLKAEMKFDPSQSSHTSGSEVLILHFLQFCWQLTCELFVK